MNNLRIMLFITLMMLAFPIPSRAEMVIITLESLDDADQYQVKAVENAMDYLVNGDLSTCQIFHVMYEINIDGIPILAYHMKDDDPEIRYLALRVLYRTDYIPWDAKEALFTCVNDEDDRIRTTAVSILTWFGPEPEIVEILDNMWHEKDAGIRRDAVSDFGVLAARDRSLVKYILAALDDPDSSVRAMAVRVIDRLGVDSRVIDRLIELLSDDAPAVRGSSATALGNSYEQNERIINALELVLDDADEQVGINAVISMIRLGDSRDETFKIFLDTVKNRKTVHYAAREWIPNKITPSNILLLTELIELLKDPDENHDRINEFAVKAIPRLGPGATKEIAKLLYSQSADYFPNVLSVLERMGPDAKDAVPVLIDLLDLVDLKLQAGIIRVLGRIGPEEGVIPALINLMKTGEKDREYTGTDIPYQASKALSKIGPPAVPFLIEALSDEKDDTRKLAARALGRLKPRPVEAVPHLVLCVGDETRDVRNAAINALGYIGVANDDVIYSICEALGEIESTTRSAAASACKRLGPKAAGAVPALIDALKDKRNEGVRMTSALALGAIGPDAAEAIPAMIEALDDEDEDVRSRVVESLPMLGPSDEIVDALIEVALDDSLPYSWKAVRSLTWMGDSAKAAVPGLVSIMKDEDGDLDLGVVKALLYIDPDGLHGVPELKEWLDDKNSYLRVLAAELLYALGVEKERAVDNLMETIFDPSDWVRQESVWAFYHIEPEPRIIDVLIYSMGDLGTDVDDAAAGVLGSYGEDAAKAIPRLIRALDGSYGSMSRKAVEALGDIGPLAIAALPSLERISKYHIDEYIRQQAVDAIAKIKGTWEGEEES